MKTETKTTHTPTPWKFHSGSTKKDPHKSFVYISDGSRHIATLGLDNGQVDATEQKVNAAFIVRAVNAHEELLRWAKQYAFDCEHAEPHLTGGNLNLLKQAIAKAEGR